MDKGKAFEFACIIGLEEYIRLNSKDKPMIVYNSSYNVAKIHYDNLLASDSDYAGKLKRAGLKLGEILQKTEPRLFNNDSSSILSLSLQPDVVAILGDVRDILAIRMESNNQIIWEIGISCKHNHDAVRHQRVSPTIDFGKEWLNSPLSAQEFESIKQIFNQVDGLRSKGINDWNEVIDKEQSFYVPILGVIIQKITSHPDKAQLARHLLQYLIGNHDFYKLIFASVGTFYLQGFNFKGTMNLPAKSFSPSLIVNKLRLPTRLISVGHKPNSKTTIELFFDFGWQVSMRVHNASTSLEKSLKMDVRLTGLPPSLFSYSGNI